MARAHTKHTTWLIWLVALLSPIQAFQGTSILCHIARNCPGTNVAGDRQRACCDQPSSKLISMRAIRHKCEDCGQNMASAPFSSGAECPPNCWCRIAATPQHVIVQPMRIVSLAEMARLPLDSRILAAVNRFIPRWRSFCAQPADPALQVCSVLCRFLV